MSRTDITKYLFHGVGSPTQKKQNKSNNIEIEDYFPLQYGEDFETEFDVLTNIIKEGGLRATFSYRKGKSTIYGGNPVLCFTEMPLINIIQYASTRKDSNKVAEYGIAILKNEAYKFGARPVISGLSVRTSFFDSKKLILESNILPFVEQYRYVPLDLVKQQPIDWTHEREWRMKVIDKDFYIRYGFCDYYESYSINIFSDIDFSECIIVIKTLKEAKCLQKIIQKQLDAGYSEGGSEFGTKIKYLIIDEAKKHFNEDVTNIENLPKSAYYSHGYDSLTELEKDFVLKVIQECKNKAIEYANEYINKYRDLIDTSGNFKDSCGFANVCTYESENKYTRFLLDEGLIKCCNGCYILYGLHNNIPAKQGMSYVEYIAKNQSMFLNERLVDIFTFCSWLD